MSPPANGGEQSSHSTLLNFRPRRNTGSLLWGKRPKPNPAQSSSDTASTGSTSSVQTTTGSGSGSVPPAVPPPPVPAQPLPVETLLGYLSPPHVPSLGYSRSLSAQLTNCSPLPKHTRLLPALLNLCSAHSPPQCQAAGFDVISAYWESPEAPHDDLSTADRLTYFSIFTDSDVDWDKDLWEPRFKALRALTRWGKDVNGIEVMFLDVVKGWIQGAFDGLLRQAPASPIPDPTPAQRDEITERERCIDRLSAFLLKCNGDNVRLGEVAQIPLLHFYAALVHKSIDVAPPPTPQHLLTPKGERRPSHSPSMTRGGPHRRNNSTLSASSLPSPTTDPSPFFLSSGFSSATTHSSSPVTPTTPKQPPQELAIQLYLENVRIQLRSLSPSSLNDILPVLLRALSYSAYPLPRLSLKSTSSRHTTENQIMDLIHLLLGGPYGPMVIRYVKWAVFPFPLSNSTPTKNVTGEEPTPTISHPSPAIAAAAATTPKSPKEPLTSIQNAHGAFRLLRSLIRRALSARLARAYISRESSTAYSHSGAPAQLEIEQELLERAWSKDEVGLGRFGGQGSGPIGWEAGNVGRAMAGGVERWVAFDCREAIERAATTGVHVGKTPLIPPVGEEAEDEGFLVRERIENARERVLEEAAGTLRDVFSELDSREDALTGGGGKRGRGAATSSYASDVYGEDEDSKANMVRLEPEESHAVGEMLAALSKWVRVVGDGSNNSLPIKYTLPLSDPPSAPTELLRTLSYLLSRDHCGTPLNPPLSATLWTIAPFLSDDDTAKLPLVLHKQGKLEPGHLGWLDNWRRLLLDGSGSGDGLSSMELMTARPKTMTNVVAALEVVYDTVREMPSYRRPLAEVVWEFCRMSVDEARATAQEPLAGRGGAEGDALTGCQFGGLWNILGDEVVARRVELLEESSADTDLEGEDPQTKRSPEELLKILFCIAEEPDPSSAFDDDDDPNADVASIMTSNSYSSPPTTGPNAFVASPFARRQAELLPSSSTSASISPTAKEKEREGGFMSSLFGGLTSKSQAAMPAVNVQEEEEEENDDVPALGSELNQGNVGQAEPLVPVMTRPVGAVCALVRVFFSLALTPLSLDQRNLKLAVKVFDMLIDLLCRISSSQSVEGEDAPAAVSPRARIAVLQFFMRLRADRDHALYFKSEGYDSNGHIASLATIIGRGPTSPYYASFSAASSQERSTGGGEDSSQSPLIEAVPDASARRAKQAQAAEQQRFGRMVSRGRRGGHPSPSAPSRSRSRVGKGVPPPPAAAPYRPRTPLWGLPEVLPFPLVEPDAPSEGLVSYDPVGPDERLVLPISNYLDCVKMMLESETDWEILSYLLCHLPTQLANKHLFCGPKSRQCMSEIVTLLCNGIVTGTLGDSISKWPFGFKARDAHGLAYNTLSVLISYRPCFTTSQKNALVETFLIGLNTGQQTTVKCCLHALSLAAFDLQPSMTKYMSQILEKLSQIMSNAEMAVHILSFLSIVGSHRPLHANFTESEYKMVFGVALQYLQLHNAASSESTNISYALTQHVRILSYYLVYIWFLAIKIPDRPRHVPYITRQLLLANEGQAEIDDATEVCFDWLARYTYGSADPRPANSALSEVIMNPSAAVAMPETAISEKTWLLGNAIVSIRTLARHGWVEIVSRRPSGLTKFLCHVENVPLVGPGDVDPDLFSVPTSIMMERGDPTSVNPVPVEEAAESVEEAEAEPSPSPEPTEDPLPAPDSITGYVWSKSAPSQRRKEVGIDPSYFALQLASYPDRMNAMNSRRAPVDSPASQRFFGTLDRLPVIDTHKVGIMYVAPGQTTETEILQNTHGSPAYTRFLEGIGRLINLRGQVDVYAGGLEPDEDGEYAYAWWDDIGQILYHTATMMPSHAHDPHGNFKKRHIGNDYIRIVWNDSGKPYKFDTLSTQFQFINIVIEPHSLGAIAAYSNNLHENEYFKVTVQRAEGITEFAPVGDFKLISAENLPLLVRQLSLLADWFASVFSHTKRDTVRNGYKTNWHLRLEAIRRFQKTVPSPELPEPFEGVVGQESFRDFTLAF